MCLFFSLSSVRISIRMLFKSWFSWLQNSGFYIRNMGYPFFFYLPFSFRPFFWYSIHGPSKRCIRYKAKMAQFGLVGLESLSRLIFIIFILFQTLCGFYVWGVFVVCNTIMFQWNIIGKLLRIIPIFKFIIKWVRNDGFRLNSDIIFLTKSVPTSMYSIFCNISNKYPLQ